MYTYLLGRLCSFENFATFYGCGVDILDSITMTAKRAKEKVCLLQKFHFYFDASSAYCIKEITLIITGTSALPQRLGTCINCIEYNLLHKELTVLNKNLPESKIVTIPQSESTISALTGTYLTLGK